MGVAEGATASVAPITPLPSEETVASGAREVCGSGVSVASAVCAGASVGRFGPV